MGNSPSKNRGPPLTRSDTSGSAKSSRSIRSRISRDDASFKTATLESPLLGPKSPKVLSRKNSSNSTSQERPVLGSRQNSASNLLSSSFSSLNISNAGAGLTNNNSAGVGTPCNNEYLPPSMLQVEPKQPILIRRNTNDSDFPLSPKKSSFTNGSPIDGPSNSGPLSRTSTRGSIHSSTSAAVSSENYAGSSGVSINGSGSNGNGVGHGHFTPMPNESTDYISHSLESGTNTPAFDITDPISRTSTRGSKNSFSGTDPSSSNPQMNYDSNENYKNNNSSTINSNTNNINDTTATTNNDDNNNDTNNNTNNNTNNDDNNANNNNINNNVNNSDSALPITSPKTIDIEDLIQRLLDAGYSGKRTKNVCLKNTEIQLVCSKAREIFLLQPSLLELSPPVKVVGDVHGQYGDLIRIFTKCGFPPLTNYLFLGDYVDRGKQSLETILLLLCYKIKYPENFFLLRGNHECANVTRVYGFYDECKRRCNIKTWKLFIDTFNTLPIAAIVAGKIFCVHGGLSPVLNSMDEIRNIARPTDVPDFGLLNDLLWSDPADTTNEWEDNERGVLYVFSKVAINKFLQKFEFDLVCRAHMVVEDGYEFFNDRTLVTVFSAPNYCGEFDNWGAVMGVSDELLCLFELLDPLDSVALKQVMKKGKAERKSAQLQQQQLRGPP